MEKVLKVLVCFFSSMKKSKVKQLFVIRSPRFISDSLCDRGAVIFLRKGHTVQSMNTKITFCLFIKHISEHAETQMWDYSGGTRAYTRGEKTDERRQPRTR